MLKTCIACAEEIQNKAVLCRFCKTEQSDPRFLADKSPSLAAGLPETVSSGGAGPTAQPKNKIAIYALVLGIASVFLFETFIIPMASIVVGGISLGRAAELKAEGVQDRGFGFSLAGLILGIVYTLTALIIATGLV